MLPFSPPTVDTGRGFAKLKATADPRRAVVINDYQNAQFYVEIQL